METFATKIVLKRDTQKVFWIFYFLSFLVSHISFFLPPFCSFSTAWHSKPASTEMGQWQWSMSNRKRTTPKKYGQDHSHVNGKMVIRFSVALWFHQKAFVSFFCIFISCSSTFFKWNIISFHIKCGRKQTPTKEKERRDVKTACDCFVS